MIRTVNLAFILLFVPAFILTNPISSLASEVIPFEISPVLPEKQNTGVFSYYDLNVNPNEIITLSVEVKNNLDQPLIVNITPFNATTSAIGDIAYDVNHKKEQFINLKVPLKQIGEAKNGIEIAPRSAARIPIEFKLPDEDKGVVIGGIHVISAEAPLSEDIVQDEKTTFKINNQIAYIIGVKMQLPTKVAPVFAFDHAQAEISQGVPRLLLGMQNKAPAVIKDLSGTYVVTDKFGDQVLDGSFSNITMAPNTQFEYPVDWTDGQLEPGKYTVDLTADLDGKTITAKKTFTIKETEPVKEYNKDKAAAETKTDSILPWWNYFLTAAGAGFIFFIIGRKSKKKQK